MPKPGRTIPSAIVESINNLGKCPYVGSGPSVKLLEGWTVISIGIRVDLPTNGPVANVKDNETIEVWVPADFPLHWPEVFIVREDFPAVPHLSRRLGKRWGNMCLTRQPTADWWHGKSLEDVVRAAYLWLNDAAAGTLVKSDDPFEPLIADGRNPAVELDFERARAEARKHGGVWDTCSCEIAVPGSEAVRLVIAPGDVPTRLWYQEIAQHTPWVEVPVDMDGVCRLAAIVGIEPAKVRYWIEKGGERNSRILTVFGIKRPRSVLGQAEDEEWVAFDFHRLKRNDEWKVTSHLVLSQCDARLARIVSGFDAEDRAKIVVVGAGSFGSCVCEMLARSGLVNLTIVDNDVLRPHNLARHMLPNTAIGQSKAIAVAERLNTLLQGDQVARGIDGNILNMSDSELSAIVEGASCILDCSASVAVQHRLARLTDRRVPLVSGFQVLAGKGTVIFVEDRHCIGRSDAIDAAMMTRERKDPLIAAWMTEKTVPLSLGGGCSSVSARIPYAGVMFGAAWFADSVLRWLASDQWPEVSMYGILRNPAEPFGRPSTQWTPVNTEPLVSADGGWHAFVLTSVIADLNRLAAEAGNNETGGVLIGRINRQTRLFYVCEAWEAPSDSEASAVGFTRGRSRLAARLALLEADSGESLTYVGEWHAHPPHSGADMSARDSTTAREMADKLSRDRIPALCLITDRRQHDVHVVEQDVSGGGND